MAKRPICSELSDYYPAARASSCIAQRADSYAFADDVVGLGSVHTNYVVFELVEALLISSSSKAG